MEAAGELADNMLRQLEEQADSDSDLPTMQMDPQQ
jgi:hypothetical protein